MRPHPYTPAFTLIELWSAAARRRFKSGAMAPHPKGFTLLELWSAAACRRFKSGAMAPHSKGFTLIELLVVVTIIVVLLALLTPALDSAIRQAELASCGAQMKGVLNGVAQYAGSNKQTYPKRQNGYTWDALMMRAKQHPFDMISLYDGYVSRESFVDPLQKVISLDEGSNRDNTILYSNYSVYSGWGPGGFRELRKVGERFTWQDPLNQKLYKFNTLIADHDYRWPNNYTTASHPDDEGILQLTSIQDKSVFGLPTGFLEAGAPYDATISWWNVGNVNGARRGSLDNNFGQQDGSVFRITQIKMFDDRLKPVVVTDANEYNQGRQCQLPEAP